MGVLSDGTPFLTGTKSLKSRDGKVKKKELPPSVAQLAVAAVEQKLIENKTD